MIKYFMIIDNEPYNAVFADHIEAADFIDEVEREDNSIIIVNGFQEVSVEDILNDDDIEYAVAIELVASVLLPNHRDFKKWTEQEAELQRLGLIA